jgi:RNA polymerase sigma-70 factor (ECF subfamily)
MNKGIEYLWNRIQHGDKKAFDSLFKALYPSLCNFAFRILNDFREAEETAQDALVNLWQGRNKIVLEVSLKSYVYKIVYNLAINRLEHLKSKKFQPNKVIDPEQWNYMHGMLTVDDTFITMFEASETEAMISKTINQLPEKCREIFLLSRFENLSNKEIADRLSLSPTTVRVQIFKALEAIRNVLEKRNR